MRLKTISGLFTVALALAVGSLAQSIAPTAKNSSKAELLLAKAKTEAKPAAPKPAAPAPSDKDALESVLKKMDAAAANFRTTEADFQWDQFNRVISTTETQTGKIY